MAHPTQRKRLTIAAFEPADILCFALGDLDHAGFAYGQMGIVGVMPTIRQVQISPLRARLDEVLAARIIDQVVPTPAMVNEQAILATRNSLWQTVTWRQGTLTEPAVMSSWMPPRLQTDLTDHLRRGAIVLGVSSDTVEQQRQSTRILLQHSSRSVQTHEFSGTI
jgi:hypothetical protein